MRQITHAEAKAHMTDIETRLKTIYRCAHLPEKNPAPNTQPRWWC